jgi:hypothetical protein
MRALPATLLIRYKDGEKKVVVSPDTPVEATFSHKGGREEEVPPM